MNNIALDPAAGKPRAGDLVWSALPDAPTIQPRVRRARIAPLLRRIALRLHLRPAEPQRVAARA